MIRSHIPAICVLLLAAFCVPAARAADPQPYKVELASSGDGAMDATLHATSDLLSLRKSAPVGPLGLIARARSEIDRLKTVLESYGYYQSSVAIQINGMALNDRRLGPALTALPKNKEAQVAISFVLGPLYHIRRVTLDGEIPPPDAVAFGLRSGAPAVAAERTRRGRPAALGPAGTRLRICEGRPAVAYEDQEIPSSTSPSMSRRGRARGSAKSASRACSASTRVWCAGG